MLNSCRLLVITALVGAGVVACTSERSTPTFSQPPTTDFASGGCSTMAPDVLSIGRDARRLGNAATPPADVLTSLKVAQSRIRAAQPSLDAETAPSVKALVTAVGVVRLSAATGGFKPSMAADLTKAYDSVVSACTR